MGRSLALASLALLVPLAAGAQARAPASDQDRLLYALGALTAERTGLALYGLGEKELEVVARGLVDGALERTGTVDAASFIPKLNEFREQRFEQVYAAETNASAAFLEQEAKRKGVERLASGLLYEELKAGSGPTPGPSSKVRVHYHGTLRDGRSFDSSVERGKPSEFKVAGVIGCWQEGLQKMKVGGRARLICPASIAYGKRGQPPVIKPGAALVFEVELLGLIPN